MVKRGEKTCVKKLEKDHGCIPLSAKGPKSPQKISPVVVIDTVKIYFKRYRMRVCVSLMGNRGVRSKNRKVKPIQRLDCAVKYKSRVPHGENPSNLACTRLAVTPPKEEATTRIFKR